MAACRDPKLFPSQIRCVISSTILDLFLFPEVLQLEKYILVPSQLAPQHDGEAIIELPPAVKTPICLFEADSKHPTEDTDP